MPLTDPIISSFKLAISALSACSTIACSVVLCELFYFRLYKQFTYRLLIYTFAALTLSSVFTSALPLLLYSTSPATKHPESPLANLSITVKVLVYLQTSCYCTALTLGVIVTKHLHYMAVDLKYCRGSCVEFWCLICAVVFPQCYVWIPFTPIVYYMFSSAQRPSTTIDFCLPMTDPIFGVQTLTTKSVAIILISAAVLWIMCRRAYKDSEYPLLKHAQALKETVPLFCLFLFMAVCTILLAMTTLARSFFHAKFLPLLQAVVGVFVAMVGLGSAICFFTHLLALGKEKRRRLCNSGRKKHNAEANRNNKGYGSTAYAPTHWSVYTTEGSFTGSCNTEYVHVDEDEVDKEMLKNEQQLGKVLLH